MGQRHRARRWAVLLAAVFPGVAQGTGEAVHELTELPVQAWHFSGVDLAYPGDVQVLDEAAIGASFASSVPELLRRELNVRFASFNGKATEGAISLRGFGENSSARVLVLVDGLRLNRPDLGGMPWQMVSLRSVESIEVIQGGQTVLYGSPALSGVIKIRTRRDGPMKSSLRAETGSDGYASFTANHQAAQGPAFWNTSLDYLEDEGYRENSESSNRGIRGSVRLKDFFTESSQLTLSAAYTETSTQFPGPLLYAEYQADPRQSTNDGSESADTDSAWLSAVWESSHSWGESQLTAALSHRAIDTALSGRFSGNDQWTFNLSPRLRWGGSDAFTIAGIDLSGDTIDYSDYLDESQAVRRAFADLEQVTLGGYLFAQFRMADQWFLNGGIRLETAKGDFDYTALVESQLLPVIETNRGPLPNPDFKDPPDRDPLRSFDEQVSQSGAAAELSLLWRPDANTSIWLGYDRVYRYPLLDETAAYQGFDLALPVNVDLEPERGHQAEIGLKLRQANLRFSASLYLLQLSGEIIYDDAANLSRNLADTRRWGSDLSLVWSHPHWEFSTRWSFVEARFRNGEFSGKAMPLVPEVHGVTALRLMPARNWDLALYHTWTAQQAQGSDFANALRPIDAFHRFDLRLSGTWKQWRGFLLIENLFDDTHTSLAYRGGWYPAPGRQWRAGVRLEF
jgi:iron complex outermembrane receptor protein